MMPPGVTPPGVHPSVDGAELATTLTCMEWFMNFYDEAMAKEWAEYGIRVCNVAPVRTRRIPKFFAVFCRSTQWWLDRVPSLTRRRT